jgi:hypothetical protein
VRECGFFVVWFGVVEMVVEMVERKRKIEFLWGWESIIILLLLARLGHHYLLLQLIFKKINLLHKTYFIHSPENIIIMLSVGVNVVSTKHRNRT